MKPISGERATMDVHGGAGGAGKHNHHRRSSPSSVAFFSKAAGQLEAAMARIQWGPTRRALPTAVCVAAALATAIVVLTVAGGGAPNGMPASLFFDDEQGVEDISPSDLTADHLLYGLLTPEFSYRSCRSRYEFAGFQKKSLHKPSPYLIAKLRKQETLQRRCGPGTAAHKEALRRLESGEAAADPDNRSSSNKDDCRYLVYINYRGLGNRMLAIASAFLYATLTDRVLLVDGGKEDVADLFCEPFPGTTWLLPRAAGSWWPWCSSSSPLGCLQNFDEESRESLGNMLQNGAVHTAGDGNVTWSAGTPPPYVYLHLAGGYGYHDKLFFCGAHQRLLSDVPWLLMRTDNYIVPGLFLTPPFRDDLEAMFPEKDAVFYLIGRYLFHPSNAVWHAVTSYHRDHLAGAGRRVGIQIRVFHKTHPREHVLDQVLSCVRDEHLLSSHDNATSSPNVVLVTSLSPWYMERIKDEYGSSWEVHQPSHEGRQRRGDAAHDMRALSEMLLLGTCDSLVTSGFSTFGYVAQGLAGLRPWVMPQAPMWASDWREGIDPDEPPCRRMASVEPCFHSPSAYDCAVGKDVELDGITRYIRRCVDVKWGIKLVNESSSNSSRLW